MTKLVVRTDPEEKVDLFYVYIDQLKVLTDTHVSNFDGENLTATLDEPLYGLAAGQALVIYDGDRVVGSATIDHTDQAIGSSNGN